MLVIDLTGRVAVVTGGSRGIGRAIAAHFAHSGAHVVISGRDAETLDRTAESIGATAVRADATVRDEAARPVGVAVDSHGRIDVLVNNVGGAITGDRGELSAFERSLVLNLTSAHWATEAARGPMVDAGYGRVVMIGSGASRRAAATPGYTAAKHGLVGLTRQLAQDLGPTGITVNCVLPGWTDTDLIDFERIGQATATTAAEARAVAEADAAQGRILDPSEIAPLVALLASPAGGAITGQVIGVDAGYKL